MKKRLLSFFLLVSMLSSAVSCGSAPEETDAFSAETPAAVSEEIAEETEPPYEGLEAVDFGGVNFTIANRAKSPNYNAHPNPELDAPELTGEALNDAIFTRNQILEEKYNIKLISRTFTAHADISAEIQKAITAGDATYDAAFPGIAVSFQMAMNGHLYEINDIPHLQTDRSWWMGNALSNTSIGGKNYFISGDMNIGAMNASGIVYFNKQLLSDYQIDSPYTYVDEHKWTLDAMTTLSSVVTHDADGNGVLDQHDVYGTVCSSFAWQPLFYGSGQLLIPKDENDLPFLDAASEQNYDTISSVVTFLNNNASTYNVNHSTGIADLGALTVDMFYNNQALFFIELMYGVPEFREMESDFGLLPLPKASETQEKYSTYLHPDNTTTVVVPVINTNTDMAGMILEDMAFYSSEHVRPAFYDIMLKSKFARDEDSARMLDIILSNSTIDLALIMKNSGIDIDTLMRSAATEGTTDILSTIAANNKKYTKILEKAIEALS